MPLTYCRNSCPVKCLTFWMWWTFLWYHLTCSFKLQTSIKWNLALEHVFSITDNIGNFTLFLFPPDLVFLVYASPQFYVNIMLFILESILVIKNMDRYGRLLGIPQYPFSPSFPILKLLAWGHISREFLSLESQTIQVECIWTPNPCEGMPVVISSHGGDFSLPRGQTKRDFFLIQPFIQA